MWRLELDITQGIKRGGAVPLYQSHYAFHTAKRGEYYVILPMLPELRKTDESRPMVMTRELSSENNVVDLEGTVALLHEHHLLLGEVQLSEGGELLA